MKYERLTKQGMDWHDDVQCDDEKIYNRLAELEDKIENGTLVKLEEDKVVIPEKITEETSPEDIIKIARYNEKVRKEMAREILKSFEYCNDQTFYEQWLKLAKEYGVGVK
jgi:hypothetical protein